MMGSFVSKTLLLTFGYALPAYECFKTVNKSKPEETKQLIFWCQYWIVVAFLTVVEGFGDTCISWLPLYSEAKLAFFVFLWYTKTEDSVHLYNSFLQPYIVKHEKEIDHSLSMLKFKAMEFVGFAWNKAVIYGQKGFTGVLNNVTSQVHLDKQGSTSP
ncbi:putative HVA22-like protein g [Lotus japonicus]|uniref:putative HVA22-like protein g n=1 Tax=Lotus japonicus TaxID=34305 RepID=UPI00258AF2FD|nr:putative HVA22-like protein g [Lotus japonicus]